MVKSTSRRRESVEESPAVSTTSTGSGHRFLSMSQTGRLLSMVENHSLSSEGSPSQSDQDSPPPVAPPARKSTRASEASMASSLGGGSDDGSNDLTQSKKDMMRALLAEYGLDDDLSFSSGSDSNKSLSDESEKKSGKRNSKTVVPEVQHIFKVEEVEDLVLSADEKRLETSEPELVAARVGDHELDSISDAGGATSTEGNSDRDIEVDDDEQSLHTDHEDEEREMSDATENLEVGSNVEEADEGSHQEIDDESWDDIEEPLNDGNGGDDQSEEPMHQSETEFETASISGDEAEAMPGAPATPGSSRRSGRTSLSRKLASGRGAYNSDPFASPISTEFSEPRMSKLNLEMEQLHAMVEMDTSDDGDAESADSNIENDLGGLASISDTAKRKGSSKSIISGVSGPKDDDEGEAGDDNDESDEHTLSQDSESAEDVLQTNEKGDASNTSFAESEASPQDGDSIRASATSLSESVEHLSRTDDSADMTTPGLEESEASLQQDDNARVSAASFAESASLDSVEMREAHDELPPISLENVSTSKRIDQQAEEIANVRKNRRSPPISSHTEMKESSKTGTKAGGNAAMTSYGSAEGGNDSREASISIGRETTGRLNTSKSDPQRGEAKAATRKAGGKTSSSAGEEGSGGNEKSRSVHTAAAGSKQGGRQHSVNSKSRRISRHKNAVAAASSDLKSSHKVASHEPVVSSEALQSPQVRQSDDDSSVESPLHNNTNHRSIGSVEPLDATELQGSDSDSDDEPIQLIKLKKPVEEAQGKAEKSITTKKPIESAQKKAEKLVKPRKPVSLEEKRTGKSVHPNEDPKPSDSEDDEPIRLIKPKKQVEAKERKEPSPVESKKDPEQSENGDDVEPIRLDEPQGKRPKKSLKGKKKSESKNQKVESKPRKKYRGNRTVKTTTDSHAPFEEDNDDTEIRLPLNDTKNPVVSKAAKEKSKQSKAKTKKSKKPTRSKSDPPAKKGITKPPQYELTYERSPETIAQRTRVQSDNKSIGSVDADGIWRPPKNISELHDNWGDDKSIDGSRASLEEANVEFSSIGWNGVDKETLHRKHPVENNQEIWHPKTPDLAVQRQTVSSVITPSSNNDFTTVNFNPLTLSANPSEVSSNEYQRTPKEKKGISRFLPWPMARRPSTGSIDGRSVKSGGSAEFDGVKTPKKPRSRGVFAWPTTPGASSLTTKDLAAENENSSRNAEDRVSPRSPVIVARSLPESHPTLQSPVMLQVEKKDHHLPYTTPKPRQPKSTAWLPWARKPSTGEQLEPPAADPHPKGQLQPAVAPIVPSDRRKERGVETMSVAEQREARRKQYILDQERRESIRIQSALRGYMARKRHPLPKPDIREATEGEVKGLARDEVADSIPNNATSPSPKKSKNVTKDTTDTRATPETSRASPRKVAAQPTGTAGYALSSKRRHGHHDEPKTVAQQREERRQLYIADQERRASIEIQRALRGFVVRRQLGLDRRTKKQPPTNNVSDTLGGNHQSVSPQPAGYKQKHDSPSASPVPATPKKNMRWLPWGKKKSVPSLGTLLESPKRKESEQTIIQRFDASLYLRKRMYQDEHESQTKTLAEIQEARRQMYLRDLERREVIKIQSAARGYIARQRLAPPEKNKRKKKEKKKQIQPRVVNDKAKARASDSFDRSAYLVERLQRDEVERQMKTVAQIREERQQIYVRDLQRREATKIQAAMRGYMTRRRHPLPTSKHRQPKGHAMQKTRRPSLRRVGSSDSIDNVTKPSNSWGIMKRIFFGRSDEETPTIQDTAEQDVPEYESYDPYADTGDFLGFSDTKYKERTGFFSLERSHRTENVGVQPVTEDARNWKGRKNGGTSKNFGKDAYLRERKAREEFERKSMTIAQMNVQRRKEVHQDTERRASVKIQQLGRGFLARRRHLATKDEIDNGMKKPTGKEPSTDGKGAMPSAVGRGKEIKPKGDARATRVNSRQTSTNANPAGNGLSQTELRAAPAKSLDPSCEEIEIDEEEIVEEYESASEEYEEILEEEIIEEEVPPSPPRNSPKASHLSGNTAKSGVSVPNRNLRQAASAHTTSASKDKPMDKPQSVSTPPDEPKPKPIVVLLDSRSQAPTHSGATYSTDVGDAYWLPSVGTEDNRAYRQDFWVPDNSAYLKYLKPPRKTSTTTYWEAVRDSYLPTVNSDDDISFVPSVSTFVPSSKGASKKQAMDSDDESWLPPGVGGTNTASRSIPHGSVDGMGKAPTEEDDSWVPSPSKPKPRSQYVDFTGAVKKEDDSFRWAPHLPPPSSKQERSRGEQTIVADLAADAPFSDEPTDLEQGVSQDRKDAVQPRTTPSRHRRRMLYLWLIILALLGGGAGAAYLLWDDAPWQK